MLPEPLMISPANQPTYCQALQHSGHSCLSPYLRGTQQRYQTITNVSICTNQRVLSQISNSSCAIAWCRASRFERWTGINIDEPHLNRFVNHETVHAQLDWIVLERDSLHALRRYKGLVDHYLLSMTAFTRLLQSQFLFSLQTRNALTSRNIYLCQTPLQLLIRIIYLQIQHLQIQM